MAQPPAVYVETWNAEVDLLDPGIVDEPPRTFDFAHFENDPQSVRRLREHGQRLAAEEEADNAQLGDRLASLDAAMRAKFCLSDYRQQDIAAHRGRLERLHELHEGDAAMIKRFERENASLRTRLTTYEEDDEERVQMEEEMRRAKREEDERLRLQRNKLQQALDIAQGASSPSVAQLRNRFDSPEPTRKKQPEPATRGGQLQQLQPQPAARNGRGGGGQGFYDPKHRRSQSASRVVDHRPFISIPTGGILRARMPANAKTTVAPKADLLHNSDGYVLTHQEVDDHGNISTSIFKGDCIPTAGGGTAVCFNDIEHLLHEEPGGQTEKRRKHRSSKKTVRF